MTVADQVLRGAAFLVQSTSPADLFTPEDFTEEQKMIAATVSEFMEKEIRQRGHRLEEQVALIEEAAALGLLGSHIPEEYGGGLMDTNTNTIIFEMLGKGDGSFSTSLAAHTGIGMLPILYFGTEAQKKKYLPDMCSGAIKVSYCLTEPGSGSDALAAKTRADLSEDGKYYLLNGQKMWISNAGFADLMIVFAQVEGDKFTGFIVPASTTGITLGEEEDKLGIKGSSTRQVFFENAMVPVENVLGEVGKGHLIAFNVLNIGRFKLAVMTMGGSKTTASGAIRYANERHQFGRPISSFGAISKKLADMAVKTFMNESAVYRTSDLMARWRQIKSEEGMSFEQAKLKAAEEYAVECALLKVSCSECFDQVVDEALQIHGGYGYSEEYTIARTYRDSRINRIYEGTNEINRLLSVSMTLKRALQGTIDLINPAWAVQKELTSMPSLEQPEGYLALEQRTVSDFKKLLLMVAGAAAKYEMDGKLNLREDQEIVLFIADMMIDLYLAESGMLRILKMKQNNSRDNIELYENMLKIWLQQVQANMVKNATDALASFAAGDEQRVLLMGVKRFAKYPPQPVVQLRKDISDCLIKAGRYCF